MIIAAISDFTDNATVFHDKRLLLDLLTATVMLLQVLCRVAMRSRLLSSLSLPLLGFRATVASSVLPAELSWSCPPPTLGLAAAIGRDGSDCRLPWERFDTCMPCASAQQGSNNVSDWWKRWKQLCPLYLGTLQSGTSHVEQTQVVFRPCRLCFCSGSEWSLRQHQMQLVCLCADEGRWTTLPFILRAMRCGFAKYASRLL